MANDDQPKMKAVQWYGKEDFRLNECPKPTLKESKDVILHVTSTTICGSDLHFYHNEMAGMTKGFIMGHEFMGVIEEVGSDVKNFKVGDRVVVSFCISCGECYYCKNEIYTSCDVMNQSKTQEFLYGHRTGGMFGYSHLLGGYDGGQAEWVRVPVADINCLKIPDHLPDEKVLLLSDVLCTSWHANEMGNVEAGQTVCVWGLGPIGLMTLAWAKFRGAARLIGIDNEPHRLDVAKNKLGAQVIDFSKQDVIKTIQELAPNGPDVCIEASGFRFAKSLTHKIQRALKLETDTPEQLYECIYTVRKGGTVSVIADYYNFCNGFPIGPFMEKGLTMRGGQALVQKYWKKLLGLIEHGAIDSTFLISHIMPFDKAIEAYRIFDKHEDNATKIVLKTEFGAALQGRGEALKSAVSSGVSSKVQSEPVLTGEGQIPARS